MEEPEEPTAPAKPEANGKKLMPAQWQNQTGAMTDNFFIKNFMD
jgi:hypothetical protein